ncbi:MAG: ATP-grasp domain-containing protein [Burkholderiaceae bacterium]|nr:ATP-grasp domain-containing protein [Burkholderiaceae bacterium]
MVVASTPFRTVLIANRGEIACRIARSARQAGLRTVAVFTEADRDAPHVYAADEALHLPDLPGAPEPYLDVARIVDAARLAGAQAVHPGYGFLSENPALAEACAAAGLVFIGPGADAIRLMADKALAKRRLRAAGVPCVPGYDGEDQSDARLRDEAERIGYPVLVKAVAGGGGRGMRRVDSAGGFDEALAGARGEGRAAFGSPVVILERALDRVRHIEIQVAADRHGNVVHLGERDCSSQRRNQKVIEEAPSPAIDARQRDAMGEASVRAAAAIGYEGVGTLEFLVDERGEFHFIEMNTRLQVEHPVTECVTGIDLVDWQFRIAAGDALPMAQDEIAIRGSAIEVRLYAEDPDQGFLPQSGVVTDWAPPEDVGVRLDHAICQGLAVGVRYDPMLAKLIVHGPTREAARARLIDALRSMRIAGVVTNKAFLLRCLTHPDFVAARVHTRSLDALASEPVPEAQDWQYRVAVALAYFAEAWRWGGPPDDWSSLGAGAGQGLGLRWRAYRVAAGAAFQDAEPFVYGVRMRGGVAEVARRDAPEAVMRLVFGGAPQTARPDEAMPRFTRVALGDDPLLRRIGWSPAGDRVAVDFGALRVEAAIATPGAGPAGAGTGAADGSIRAPMAGKVVEVRAAAGATVSAGEILIVLEAMKMAHRISAPISGRLAELRVDPGDQVARADLLACVVADTAVPDTPAPC